MNFIFKLLGKININHWFSNTKLHCYSCFPFFWWLEFLSSWGHSSSDIGAASALDAASGIDAGSAIGISSSSTGFECGVGPFKWRCCLDVNRLLTQVNDLLKTVIGTKFHRNLPRVEHTSTQALPILLILPIKVCQVLCLSIEIGSLRSSAENHLLELPSGRTQSICNQLYFLRFYSPLFKLLPCK